MTTQVQKHDKTVAALIHLSTFSQFFFPLGNFFFPLLLWTARKNDPFVDEHGKQALNFQISLYLYTILILAVGFAGVIIMAMTLSVEEPFHFDHHFNPFRTPGEALPIILFVVAMGLLLLGILILNIVAVISATMKAGEGEYYKYPLTINFLNSAEKTGSLAVEKTETTEDPSV